MDSMFGVILSADQNGVFWLERWATNDEQILIPKTFQILAVPKMGKIARSLSLSHTHTHTHGDNYTRVLLTLTYTDTHTVIKLINRTNKHHNTTNILLTSDTYPRHFDARFLDVAVGFFHQRLPGNGRSVHNTTQTIGGESECVFQVQDIVNDVLEELCLVDLSFTLVHCRHQLLKLGKAGSHLCGIEVRFGRRCLARNTAGVRFDARDWRSNTGIHHSLHDGSNSIPRIPRGCKRLSDDGSTREVNEPW